jgi:hypothetical protein
MDPNNDKTATVALSRLLPKAEIHFHFVTWIAQLHLLKTYNIQLFWLQLLHEPTCPHILFHGTHFNYLFSNQFPEELKSKSVSIHSQDYRLGVFDS